MDPERDGAAGGIRTPDHLVRSQVLYPTELRPRGVGELYPNGPFWGSFLRQPGMLSENGGQSGI